MGQRPREDRDDHRGHGPHRPSFDLELTVRAAFARIVVLAWMGAGAASACSDPPPARQSVPTERIPTTFEWRLPPGLPVPRVPANNPMTPAKVALGRRLFYDTRLSGNGMFACAGCHQQARAFTDGRAHAVGSTGAAHPRSAMSLTNVAYNATFGWADPHLDSLEAQIAVPMFNDHPIELGLKYRTAEVVARFAAPASDEAEFRRAFPEDVVPVSLDNIVSAIAAFERTLVSGDAPLDRYLYRDDRRALSDAAARGMSLFFSTRLRCGECHVGFNLSGAVTFEDAPKPDVLFHNTGLYNVDGRGSYPTADRGLIDVTRQPRDMGRFRAPTLRNIEVTAPYMHDGSLPTLDAVVRHYASGGAASPYRSDRVAGFAITEAEIAEVVEFLNSLTDKAFLTNPAFSDPHLSAH